VVKGVVCYDFLIGGEVGLVSHGCSPFMRLEGCMRRRACYRGAVP
jgi:hypothetical protein